MVRVIMTLILLLAVAPAMGQGVSARVDRDKVALGETFNLVIEASGRERRGEPDLAPLSTDFDVLGTSQSTSVNWINGQMSASTRWQISLSARKVGRFRIPPIRVGSARSNPVEVEVVRAHATVPGTGGSRQKGDIFMEAEVEPESPYVQGQVTYVVRLFDGSGIVEGSITPPAPADALVERLGEDVQYNTTRNGRRYVVTERRYAIFPQSSGPLEIQAPLFSGKVRDRQRRRGSLFDDMLGGRSPFPGRDPFDGLFQTTRPVRAAGPALSVQVRPQPADAHADPWLPAESLRIEAAWSPDPPEFQVGEPVTRTITVTSRGLTAEQLPEVGLELGNDLKVYPDQPTVETKTHGVHVLGKRVQKLALVPTRPGRIVLPEIRIPWWDTVADTPKVAVLPGQTIEVLPIPGAGTQAPVPVPAPLAASPEPRMETTPPLPSPPKSADPHPAAGYWPWITAACLLAWLLTVLLWVRERHSRRAAQAVTPGQANSRHALSLRSARRALEVAARANDPDAARSALLAWAAARWPEHTPPTLLAVAARFQMPEAEEAIETLDRYFYCSDQGTWRGETLLRAVLPILGDMETPPINEAKPLPALYPTH